MKRIPTSIAIICGTLSLTWALDASAARSIRTDQNGSNGWSTCIEASSGSCVSLPPGLQLSPDTATPRAGSYFTGANGWTTFDGGATFVNSQGTDLQDWSTMNAAGLPITAQGLTIDNSTSPIDYQVMYFNLSGADAGGVYSGNGGNTEGQTLMCAPDMLISGTGTACASDQAIGSIGDSTTAWEIEFNYNTIPAGGASLEFDGITYTASQSVLEGASDSNAFVYYDGSLYCPAEWTSCGRSNSGGSVAEPGAAGLLSAAATAWLFWFAGRKASRKTARGRLDLLDD